MIIKKYKLFFLIITIPIRVFAGESITVDGYPLGSSDLPKKNYICETVKFLPGETMCKRSLPGKAFGMPASKIELMFSKRNELYIIFVELNVIDAASEAHSLNKKYGSPVTYKKSSGVITDVWSLPDMSITVKKDYTALVGNITIVKQ